jgi:hypothetical protein
MIIDKTATRFTSRAAAEHCAYCNNRGVDGEGWIFKVVPLPGGKAWAVIAADEDGAVVGTM